MPSFNDFRDLHDKITSIVSPVDTQIWYHLVALIVETLVGLGRPGGFAQGSRERFGKPRSQLIIYAPFLPVPMERSCYTLYDQRLPVFSVMEIRDLLM
jgi:hypothetical protein